MTRISLTAPQLDDLERGIADEYLLSIAMPQLVAIARRRLDKEFRKGDERREKLHQEWRAQQAAEKHRVEQVRREALAAAIAQFSPFHTGAPAPFAIPMPA